MRPMDNSRSLKVAPAAPFSNTWIPRTRHAHPAGSSSGFEAWADDMDQLLQAVERRVLGGMARHATFKSRRGHRPAPPRH
jgi:hypothetical protein